MYSTPIKTFHNFNPKPRSKKGFASLRLDWRSRKQDRMIGTGYKTNTIRINMKCIPDNIKMGLIKSEVAAYHETLNSLHISYSSSKHLQTSPCYQIIGPHTQDIKSQNSLKNQSDNTQTQQLKSRIYLNWKSQSNFRAHQHVSYEIPHKLDP